jgi:hypothetical protein
LDNSILYAAVSAIFTTLLVVIAFASAFSIGKAPVD